MKRQLIQIASIIILIVIEFMACTTSQDSEPNYDPNKCTEYACPMHQDKIYVAPEICPECGQQMIHKDSINSLIKTVNKSSLDSLDLYHNFIMEQSDRIIKNSKLSKEEQFIYLLHITKNLNKAKIVNENLNKLVYGKRKLALRSKHKKLDRLYAAASYRVTCISSELNKSNYNQDKIKLYAKELKEIVYDVDKEQHVIRLK